jgi:hypothetical protein
MEEVDPAGPDQYGRNSGSGVVVEEIRRMNKVGYQDCAEGRQQNLYLQNLKKIRSRRLSYAINAASKAG